MNNKSKITSIFTAIRSTESTCSSETSSETVNVKKSIDEHDAQSLDKKFNSQVCYNLQKCGYNNTITTCLRVLISEVSRGELDQNVSQLFGVRTV